MTATDAALAATARTHAALAIEAAMPEDDRARLLAGFRDSTLNGADVADILDILDDHDHLLPLREPFYEADHDGDVWRLCGWLAPEVARDLHTYDFYLRSRLVGYAVLATALLTRQVPAPQRVATLAGAALTVAAERWPAGDQ